MIEKKFEQGFMTRLKLPMMKISWQRNNIHCHTGLLILPHTSTYKVQDHSPTDLISKIFLSRATN